MGVNSLRNIQLQELLIIKYNQFLSFGLCCISAFLPCWSIQHFQEVVNCWQLPGNPLLRCDMGHLGVPWVPVHGVASVSRLETFSVSYHCFIWLLPFCFCFFFTCFISSLVRILCFLYFHTSPRPFSNQLPKATVKYVCPSARSKEQNIQTAVCKLIAPPFSTSSQEMCLIHSYEPFKWLCVFSFVSGWDHMRHKHKPNWEDNKQQSSWISYCCLAPDFAFAVFWTLGICSETFSWIAAGMRLKEIIVSIGVQEYEVNMQCTVSFTCKL